MATPTSTPWAVNGVGADMPISDMPPHVEAGSASVTIGGTVNVPAPAAAMHVNIAPVPVCDASENPEIFTKPFGSPPVHVTVAPCTRVTLALLAAFDQTIGAGTVS